MGAPAMLTNVGAARQQEAAKPLPVPRKHLYALSSRGHVSDGKRAVLRRGEPDRLNHASRLVSDAHEPRDH
jgi:hypothetical protein